MNGPLKLIGNRNYDVYIRRFNRYLAKRRRIAPHIVPFIEGLKSEGLSPSSQNQAKHALWKAISVALAGKGRYDSLARFRLLFDQIKIHRPTEVITREMILSRAEMEQFTKLCEPRFALVAWFIWQTGSRIGVAMRIKLHDCKIDGDIVAYAAPGKGGRMNRLNWTLDLHREIVKEFGSVTHLFQARRGKKLKTHMSPRSVQRYFRTRTIGQPKSVHPHLLRHSCATRLLDAGANAKEISLWLNHASVTTTLNVYCHADRAAAAQLARLAASPDSLNQSQRPSDKSA